MMKECPYTASSRDAWITSIRQTWILKKDGKFHSLNISLAWFEAKASILYSWQSLISCWAMAVKAVITNTVEPIVEQDLKHNEKGPCHLGQIPQTNLKK